MVAGDEVDKVADFLHKRFWKLLYLCDRIFSDCHNHHLRSNHELDRRQNAYVLSLVDGDRAGIGIPVRSLGTEEVGFWPENLTDRHILGELGSAGASPNLQD